MATTTFYPAAGDGIVRNSATGSGGSAWTTLRNAATGTVVDYTTNPQVCVMCDENSFADSKQYIDRGFFPFDTSSLPDGATVAAVTFNLYVVTVTATAGGSVNVYESTQASTTTLSTADFDACGSTAWATAINFASINAGAYNTWTLNSTGRSAVNKTGNTMVCLRGSFDVNNSPPTSGQRSSLDSVRYSEHTGTGSDPYLSVEWYMDSTFTADAVIVEAGSVTVTADADVSIGRATKTHTADGFIDRKSVVADNFIETGGSAVNLSSHTPTGVAAGGTWSSHPASGISSSVIGSSGGYVYQSTGTSIDLNSTSPPSADYDVEATFRIMATAYSSGLLARWDTTATTGYSAILDGGGITAAGYVRLYKHVAGVASEIGTAYNIGSYSGTHRMRLRCNGSKISLWWDGAEVISVTDTAVSSAGKAGLRITGTTDSSTARISDWGVFTDLPKTNTFTADAIVQDITATKTVTADAIVTGSVEKTFTADAIVNGIITAVGVTQGTGTPQTVSGLTDGSDSLDYNAFLGLCEAPNGNLVIAYHHADGHVGTGTNKLDVKIGTPDGSGGYTWGSRTTLRTTTGTSGATPGNIADVGLITLANGQILLTWNESTTPGTATIQTVVRFQSMWSSDNGASWGQKATPTDSVITTTAVPGWATTVSAGSGGGAYAVAPCKPVQLANGDLLMATYGWDDRAIVDAGGSFSSREYVKCMKSTDNGSTWTQVGTIFPDTVGSAYDETDLLVLDNGTILAACRKITGTGTGYNIVIARSSDSGVTWGSESIALGSSSSTGWGGRPSLVQTPNGGVLLRTRYMSAGASSWSGYRLSLDRGATWGSGIDPYTGGAEGTGIPSTPRGMDIYGEWAPIGSSNSVAYAWSEEVVGSDAAVIYFRVVSVYGDATFTADAVVSSSFTTQATRTFTADAIVQDAGLTKTVTADAVVSDTVSGLRTYTKTLTADAYITSDPGASFTAGLFFYSNVGQYLEFWGQD